MELAGRSLKGQRGHANRIGARLLAFVEPHQTALRDMQDGSEETLETGTVVHAALRRLRDSSHSNAVKLRLREVHGRCRRSTRAAILPK